MSAPSIRSNRNRSVQLQQTFSASEQKPTAEPLSRKISRKDAKAQSWGTAFSNFTPQTSNFLSARLLKLHATGSNFTIHPSNF
ncbi:MAG: hypothetical protein ACSHYA_17295 [Opitutaceae bacterium]